MPAYPQIATFGQTPVIGLDAILSRGPRPGVFRLRVPHAGNLDVSSVSDLVIQSNDEPITFAGCVADLSTTRMPFAPVAGIPMTRTPGKREFVLKVRDRRQQWQGLTISGEYNARYRDCTIKPATQKTIDELGDLLLTAAGETPTTSTGLTGAYPAAKWPAASLVASIEQLQDILPVHVCRDFDDAYSLRATAASEDLSGYVGTTPDYFFTAERGPKTIKVVCGPTLFQCFLTLEAVGRDTDGAIKPIDDLSYKPTGGWANEHPMFFAGVDINYRHLALETVYRMYRVTVQSVSGSSTTISDVRQFDLDDVLVSMAGTSNSKVVIPAFVKGQFYPYSDRFVNTGSCVHWAGRFTINKESRCVEFPDGPVYSAGSCISPATLYLCTGFRVRSASTWAYDRKEFTLDRDTGQGEQVLDHSSDLWETVVESFLASCSNSGSPTKNTSAIQAEADVYLNAWKNHWDNSRVCHDQEFSGTLPIGLSGAKAQITYRLGRNMAPITRVSQHVEHALLTR